MKSSWKIWPLPMSLTLNLILLLTFTIKLKKKEKNKTHTWAIKVKRINLTSFFRVEKILQVNFFSFCHIHTQIHFTNDSWTSKVINGYGNPVKNDLFRIIFEVITEWPLYRTANLLSPASINQRTDCDQYWVETWTFLWPYQPTANVYWFDPLPVGGIGESSQMFQ